MTQRCRGARSLQAGAATLIAGNVVKGIVEAYRTQRYLPSKHLADYVRISRVTLLAGPAFFDAAGNGIRTIASVR
jgi:hypothetical protein